MHWTMSPLEDLRLYFLKVSISVHCVLLTIQMWMAWQMISKFPPSSRPLNEAQEILFDFQNTRTLKTNHMSIRNVK